MWQIIAEKLLGEKDQKISELDEKLAAANLTITHTLEGFKAEMAKTVAEQERKNGAAIEQLKTELRGLYEDKIIKQEEKISEQSEENKEQREKITALEEKMRHSIFIEYAKSRALRALRACVQILYVQEVLGRYIL